MNKLSSIVMRIFSIALAIVILPILAFFGLVMIGLAAIAGIIGAVTFSSRIKAMRENMSAQQNSRFRSKPNSDKFKDGPIIDADPS